jgi:hypothetical protein
VSAAGDARSTAGLVVLGKVLAALFATSAEFFVRHARVPEPLVEFVIGDAGPWIGVRHDVLSCLRWTLRRGMPRLDCPALMPRSALQPARFRRALTLAGLADFLVGSVPVFAAADRVAGPSSDGEHGADDQDDDADRPDDRDLGEKADDQQDDPRQSWPAPNH